MNSPEPWLTYQLPELPQFREIAARPRSVEISVIWGLAVLGHLLLLYLGFSLAVHNDLIQMPPSMSVRLLPLAEEKKVEPAKAQPPKPAPPQMRRPLQQPQPVLAVTNNAPTSSAFVVAAQPDSPPPQAITAAPAAPPTVVAARFDADYLHNPAPAYPPLSRRQGEEGKVLLKVRVSAHGAALEVSIAKSSGYGRLDSAAADAVQRWRFVPAKRGDEAVDSSVIVPITFALE